jgi:hypothetical protein
MRALTVEPGPVEPRSVHFSEEAVRLAGLITQLRQLSVAPLVARAAQDLAASVVLPWWCVPKAPTLWSQTAVLGSLWPVLLGAGLTLAAVLWRAHLTRQPGAMPPSNGQAPVKHPMARIPPGDLLAPISRCITPALTHGRRLAEEQLPRCRDARLASLRRTWSNLDWWRIIGRIESSLNHWPTALVILVLLGLITAALGASE